MGVHGEINTTLLKEMEDHEGNTNSDSYETELTARHE